MKNYITIFCTILFCGTTNAQIINIPDANFKAKLLQANTSNYVAQDFNNNSVIIDSNSNGEIDLSEALLITTLNVSSSNINNLTGINSFTNLNILICENNLITVINLTNLTNLISLRCGNNSLSLIDVSGLNNLEVLECQYNNLTFIDLSMLSNLHSLRIYNNQLTNLDLSNNHALITFGCGYNNLLNINVKNGNPDKAFSNDPFIGCAYNPNLSYICVDDNLVSAFQSVINTTMGIPSNVSVNSYCSFTPGGVFYTIQGTTKYDDENNGCDASDGFIPNVKLSLSNGTATGTVIANTSGNYALPVQSGTYTITPILENLSYFTVTPPSSSIPFPTSASPFTQNFCISPNGVHNDLAVELVPISSARPGFDAIYKIKYKNKGTQTQSGSVSLTFQDAVLDLVSSSPSTTTAVLNSLTWSFTNLQPFESREINFVLNVNSTVETPAVNQGDILHFTSVVVGLTDETPTDNNVEVNQIVVNALDPNDKTCLEGNTISPSKIGDYVHYKIRFENSGTANATNIVVKDIIDTNKFDISTLLPIDASHSFTTRIISTNQVEFIFQNINLPFDDATNDGYVVFKIKSKPTLVVGDQIANNANIYFDYNAPVVTNTAISTFQVLANNTFEFTNYFTLSPVPTSKVLSINTKQDVQISSVSIYNALGQLILVTLSPNNDIDVSNLKTGTYFIKIASNKGIANSKFVKE